MLKTYQLKYSPLITAKILTWDPVAPSHLPLCGSYFMVTAFLHLKNYYNKGAGHTKIRFEATNVLCLFKYPAFTYWGQCQATGNNYLCPFPIITLQRKHIL